MNKNLPQELSENANTNSSGSKDVSLIKKLVPGDKAPDFENSGRYRRHDFASKLCRT